MRPLTNLVHSLFCCLNHLQEMEEIKKNRENPQVCLFYLEQVFDTAWEQRDHVAWLKNTEKLLQELDVEAPAEAFSLLNQSLAITRAVSPLINEHPGLKQLIIKLIEVM